MSTDTKGFEYITGKCKWAKVIKPEQDLNGKEKFSIDVIVDKATAKKFSDKGIKVKQDKDGDLFLKFKTNAKFPDGNPAPLAVVDKNNKPMAALVGNGSEVTVAYKEHPYELFSGGISLILCGVKVLDLVEFTESGGNPFGSPEADEGNPFA